MRSLLIDISECCLDRFIEFNLSDFFLKHAICTYVSCTGNKAAYHISAPPSPVEGDATASKGQTEDHAHVW